MKDCGVPIDDTSGGGDGTLLFNVAVGVVGAEVLLSNMTCVGDMVVLGIESMDCAFNEKTCEQSKKNYEKVHTWSIGRTPRFVRCLKEAVLWLRST